MYAYIHTYVHTYIHTHRQTDRQTQVTFNTSVWESIRLALINSMIQNSVQTFLGYTWLM